MLLAVNVPHLDMEDKGPFELRLVFRARQFLRQRRIVLDDLGPAPDLHSTAGAAFHSMNGANADSGTKIIFATWCVRIAVLLPWDE